VGEDAFVAAHTAERESGVPTPRCHQWPG
jgi:hypothetical protein